MKAALGNQRRPSTFQRSKFRDIQDSNARDLPGAVLARTGDVYPMNTLRESYSDSDPAYTSLGLGIGEPQWL